MLSVSEVSWEQEQVSLILGETREEKITVPAGATCDGTNATFTVRGGVRVRRGATFILGSEGNSGGGTISGGVRANDAASVQLHFARVSGAVRIVAGMGSPRPSRTTSSTVARGSVTTAGSGSASSATSPAKPTCWP